MTDRPSRLLLIMAVIMLVVVTLIPFAFVSPASGCVSAPTNGSQDVVLFSQGTQLPLIVGVNGTPVPTVSSFCIGVAVTLVGAWNATTPVAVSVEGPVFEEPCRNAPCGSSGSFDRTLFPGSWDLDFDGSNNGTVTITQPIELVFDMVTLVLQPATALNLGPMGYRGWPLSIPPGAGSFGIFSLVQFSDIPSIYSVGYMSGLMDPSQWTAFQNNASAFNWNSLPWSEGGQYGGGPPLEDWNLTIAAGSYTLVFCNTGSESIGVQFQTPLYATYASAGP